MSTYLPIIGLEIHVELATKSKMFCGCDAAWQKYKQNENTCPVCLGMPGALPVPNKTAVEYTIKLAQALGCRINEHSHFDRKHYFYPDLPKGYQISQYDEPIGVSGEVPVLVRDEPSKSYIRKSFRIHRVHLEEDTGKLSHIGSDTVVDFNRSSVPLVEIVTEADFRSSEDVKVFLQELHTIIRTLGISEADMEQGSMRMEPNISVKIVEGPTSNVDRLDPDELPKYKVEVKNINSFNYVKKAIDFEVKRHTEILEKGETPVQETRGWDDTKSITYSQRVKENAHDYRYFPEPDIPPMVFDKQYLESIQKSIPELPIDKVTHYKKDGVKESDAILLTRDVSTSSYFDQVREEVAKLLKGTKSPIVPQVIANALINKKISSDLAPNDFAARLVEMSKPKETDMGQLEKVVQEVIAANQKSVDDYRSGKTNAIMFLVGQVMKGMKGQAEAGTVRAALEKSLN